jgi:hypothetical protein
MKAGAAFVSAVPVRRITQSRQKAEENRVALSILAKSVLQHWARGHGARSFSFFRTFSRITPP